MAVGFDTFEEFLTNAPIQVDLPYLVLALIVSAILSFILAKVYVRYGTSISNKEKFSGNFILLTATTTLVIMIIKSSLALALGLVGALSIVRFRAAIKEPEELAFLFLCIAIGLGLGAGQLRTTVVAFAIITLFISGRYFLHKKESGQNLYLTVSGKNISLKKIVEILKRNSLAVQLKRFDELEDNSLEASFLVDFKSFSQLEKAKEELNSLSKSVSINYLDKSGI